MREDKTMSTGKGRLIATLSGVTIYDTIRLNGLIQGQRVMTLVDGGVTHNFIYTTLVAGRGLQTKEFEGFIVAMVYGYTMTCLDRVPYLEVKLGNYTLTYTFYVVHLSETHVVLGVKWLYSLGKISTNYHTLMMRFKDANDIKVVFRGMSIGESRTLLEKRIKKIFQT